MELLMVYLLTLLPALIAVTLSAWLVKLALPSLARMVCRLFSCKPRMAAESA